MAIESPHTAPNFVFGNYFKILRAEMACQPNDPRPRVTVWVGFYVSAYARDNNGSPPYTYAMTFTIEEMLAAGFQDPRDWMYPLLMQSPLFKGVGAAPEMAVRETALLAAPTQPVSE